MKKLFLLAVLATSTFAFGANKITEEQPKDAPDLIIEITNGTITVTDDGSCIIHVFTDCGEEGTVHQDTSNCPSQE